VRESLTLEVHHIELYLRRHDTFGHDPELLAAADWANAAKVVDAVPDGKADVWSFWLEAERPGAGSSQRRNASRFDHLCIWPHATHTTVLSWNNEFLNDR
jgi:hypothetical protein